jgi:hypothetical protein
MRSYSLPHSAFNLPHLENTMFTQPIPGARGRRRILDRQKKQLVVNAVSRGATMTEAAIAVNVSLRTVQREAREDSHFDQELRLAHADKAHPLDLMESAARTHWRAAAWLLERTNPEQYGRRSALSCTPFQFEEALKVVVEAALRLAPPENRASVYAELTAAGDTAFQAVFPTCGPGSRRLVERLPDTPLGDEQRMRRDTEPQFQRVIFQDGTGCITEPSLYKQPPRETPDRAAATVDEAADPFVAPYLKPRALPGGTPPSQPDAAPHSKPPALPGDNSPPRATVNARQKTPGQSPGLPTSGIEESIASASTASRNPADAQCANLTPTPTRNPNHPSPSQAPSPKPSPPAPRLSWRYFLRAAATIPTAPSTPTSDSITHPPILSHLSPKTSVATEFNPNDKPPRNAPVSREAVAVFDPEAQTRRERGVANNPHPNQSNPPSTLIT